MAKPIRQVLAEAAEAAGMIFHVRKTSPAAFLQGETTRIIGAYFERQVTLGNTQVQKLSSVIPWKVLSRAVKEDKLSDLIRKVEKELA